MNEIALVFGYALFCIYIFYLSYDLMGKPRNNIERTVLKWIQPQNIAIFVRFLGMWSVVGGLGLLRLMADSGAYEDFFQAIFVVSIYVTFAIMLIYLVLYLMFQITVRMQEVGTWGKMK